MELKICPDGQNKGFGLRSGKQREGGRQEKGKGRCGGGGGGGGMKRAEKLNKTRGEKERRDQRGGGGRGRKLTERPERQRNRKKRRRVKA